MCVGLINAHPLARGTGFLGLLAACQVATTRLSMHHFALCADFEALPYSLIRLLHKDSNRFACVSRNRRSPIESYELGFKSILMVVPKD